MAQAPAVSVTAPTLHIDGQAYPLLTHQLQAMEMTEQEGGMSSLEVRVSDWVSESNQEGRTAFEDEKVLKLGSEITVYGGDPNDSALELFRGKITGFEAEFADGPPELVVLAEDAFQQARMARRTKVWQNTSVADVAKAVASQLNLKPVITGLTDSIPVLLQLNESDLAFLRRLLTRQDADMQVVGAEMQVSARKDVKRGKPLDLKFNDDIYSARILADLSHQVTEVTVTGWDYKQGSRISKKSTGSFLQPGQGRSGSDLLRNAIGARSEHVGDPGVLNDAEAQALADAIFDRRSRPFVSIEASAKGNPNVRVGTQLNLTGFSSRFDNSYYVVRCTHKYELTNGYVTNFQAECAYLGAAS